MMSRRKSRLHRTDATPELNVTPFMNLMIVLVPVLLLSLVFTHTTVVELDFPSAANDDSKVREDTVEHLEISILQDALVVADHRGVVKRIPMVAGEHDFVGLSQTMLAVKQQMPAKRDALILLQPNTTYQSLVYVLDNVKSYGTLELFPNVALGDAAPENLPVSTQATKGAS